MALKAIIAGPAFAIADAVSSLRASGHTSFDIVGAVVVGAGDVPIPVISRAAIWETIDFSGISARAVVLAANSGDGAVLRALLGRAADAGMKVFVADGGELRRLRLDDLLVRPLGAMDTARIRDAIEGRRVLITGGGGSIGSELARRISGFNPERLTLLDASEHNLYRIGLDLPDAVPALADIRDPASMRRWFAKERPHIVFHAAALKQVPLVEAFPCEGVLTNVCGLRNVAEAAHAVGADLIFVSTDKAVEPSGVMGASKRLGELYCQALDRRGARRAIPVRLGNVLGSAGSVSPIFEAQLEAGGPLTVTDPDVTRFFLSIPQAANSLLQAAATALDSAQRGTAIVLEMGEPWPVVDLAREVIRLKGLRPEVDVPIVFTGLRPGEKLHEALVATYEWREVEPAPGVIAVASRPRGLSELHAVMERLAILAHEHADAAVRDELFAAIAEEMASEELAAAG